MLDVKKSHIDFGLQLQPPPGFAIDYAVATTYSLDLFALLSIPLAMYYKQSMDVEVTAENFQVLGAIEDLQKHLKIFCQKGKISLPRTNAVSLLAFVEKCVVEVLPDIATQSFHPKVWVLRYKATDSEEVIYRLIVMSRNLTFDKSYDIAYWMEGSPSGGKKTKNKELVELMTSLDKRSPFTHKKFIQDLAKVDFELSEQFNSYSFSSFPKSNAKQSIDLDTKYGQRMVISPFLSEKILEELSEKSVGKLIIFSRKEELDKLQKKVTDALEAYCFSQEVVNHHLYELAEEGASNEYENQEWDNNLHAKIYLRENKGETFWDLGSANCSNAAFDRNHEFLIHLSTNLKETRIAKVKESLLSEYNGVRLFKAYERSFIEEVVAKEEDSRALEYELMQCLADPTLFTAKVEPSQSNYNLLLELNCGNILERYDCSLSCKPLGFKTALQELIPTIPVVFTAIPLNKLSSFIHWQIKVNKTGKLIDLVIKTDIQDMPEGRLSNILKSIIDNPDKFMAFLRAMLTDEPEGEFKKGDGNSAWKSSFLDNPSAFGFNLPIYEELLISLSRSPERLIRLSSFIDKLSADTVENQIIPTDFSNLWKTIKEALPK